MLQRKPFPFSEFEPRWQQHWLESGAFRAPNPGEPNFDASKPKLYVLDMFPYPSGDGLHIGHPLQKTACDIVVRARRMQGWNVLFPAGWDSFGLPAEQYAVKTGRHPRVTTEKNIANFTRQIKQLGFSYDWDREIATSDPAYFKWTQWIFLKIYNSYFDEQEQKARPIEDLPIPAEIRAQGEEAVLDYIDSKRLAYVDEQPVNWSPDLGTVLANEEVEEWTGKGFRVERRPMRQWMLRIRCFAQRLLDDLSVLDWSESLKQMQRNWIGRSEGAIVSFAVSDASASIEVFTTRPDTLFGASYMVLAPEHPLVEQIVVEEQWPAVREYREKTARKSDLERTDLAKDKSGVFTGAYAINPVNKQKIPIWIADYVLLGYGTGAIMAVPAHDERDFEFATKFGLPIERVVQRVGESSEGVEELPFVGEGAAVNSDFLNGLATAEAKKRMAAWLEEKGVGRATVNFKLRDWLFSRQRYWGEPFPIVWKNGRHYPLAESDLPLLPPEMEDFKPAGDGRPPLAKAREWCELPDGFERETNTMPQWAGSCWYYLRFLDPKNGEGLVDPALEKYWMQPHGVDLYIGGVEHAVLHLLYARFWHKVLFDLGYVSTVEPFYKLVNQGLILGEDNQKMSKSRGNVINPDEIVVEYGADAMRLFEMFMGPLEQMKPWSMKGVEGVFRFLARVWRLGFEENQEGEWILSPALAETEFTAKQARVVHGTIKKVTDDVQSLSFNTAISQMMIFVNEFTGVQPRPLAALRTLLPLLSPFAPHLAEEMWLRLGKAFPGFEGSASLQPWPKYDESFLIENEVEILLQVNGKPCDRIVVPKDAPQAELEKLALAHEKLQERIEGKSVVKVIVVPGRLVNVVVR
jgi:leucyl-tRNA synthetase